MRFRNAPSLNVVKREDKEQQLKQFIAEFILRQDVERPCAGARPAVTLLARSAASPVARAVLAERDALSRHGIVVHAIFAMLEPAGELAGWIDKVQGGTLDRVRWARNPRLIDAHEQLVTGAAMSWSGDSMRREPSKRDAFERYARDDALAAAWASRTFARMWGASGAIPSRILAHASAPASSEASAHQAIGAMTGLAGGQETLPPALRATRH